MIESIVVDTDVVSYTFKEDTRADLYAPHLTGKVMVISFMTVAEIHLWAQLRNWSDARQKQMARYLGRFAVFHSDQDLCIKWAHIRGEAKRAGRPIETADAWIAATALLLQIPIVTHNKRHYIGVDGLQIVSEGA